jgi:hypothetical protein
MGKGHGDGLTCCRHARQRSRRLCRAAIGHGRATGQDGTTARRGQSYGREHLNKLKRETGGGQNDVVWAINCDLHHAKKKVIMCEWLRLAWLHDQAIGDEGTASINLLFWGNIMSDNKYDLSNISTAVAILGGAIGALVGIAAIIQLFYPEVLEAFKHDSPSGGMEITVAPPVIGIISGGYSSVTWTLKETGNVGIHITSRTVDWLTPTGNILKKSRPISERR